MVLVLIELDISCSALLPVHYISYLWCCCVIIVFVGLFTVDVFVCLLFTAGTSSRCVVGSGDKIFFFFLLCFLFFFAFFCLFFLDFVGTGRKGS